MAGEQPKGRTMRELRAIVAADNERFDALGELWSSLSAVEQQKLVDEAKRMVEISEGGLDEATSDLDKAIEQRDILDNQVVGMAQEILNLREALQDLSDEPDSQLKLDRARSMLAPDYSEPVKPTLPLFDSGNPNLGREISEMFGGENAKED